MAKPLNCRSGWGPGTGERLFGRKQSPPPVSWTGGRGTGTQDAGQRVG